MSRLIETIHIKRGQILNLSYHNERFNQSRRTLFRSRQDLNLENYIHVSQAVGDESIKCRVLYNTDIERIEFLQYKPKKINSLLAIENDDISYNYKYEDRSELKELYNHKDACDDILIIKNGLITDTYYCNVALLKNGQWVTPKSPLLKGVQRASLIDHGSLITADISSDSLFNYKSIRLFNSMLPFGQIELPIKAIKFLD